MAPAAARPRLRGATGVDARALGRAALVGAAALGYLVVLAPIVFVCWLSFFANEVVTFPPEGYTLRWFARITDQNNFVSGFVTSLQLGVAAMAGGLLLGVPASLVLARRRFPGREALSTLLLMPLVVPGVVAGTAIYVFQIEAEIATTLPLLGSFAGLVLAHVMITLPVLLGGPLFQMMGPTVYGQFVGVSNWPFGAALAFVLMAATLVLTVASNWVAHRRYRR